MGAALRKELKEYSQGVSKEVAEMRQETRASQMETGANLKIFLTKEKAERKSDVKDVLVDFRKMREQASLQLKKVLSEYECGLKNEVSRARQELRADMSEAWRVWQELSQNRQKGSAETDTSSGVSVKVSEENQKILPPETREEMEKKKIEDDNNDVFNWETKILEAIRGRSEGVTLTELAGSFGVAPVVLGRASKNLLDRTLIRKNEKLYFPIINSEEAPKKNEDSGTQGAPGTHL
jgi:hypothetical protein